MKTSDKGIAALILHEDIVPGPYRDSVGVWTYGIGHTASAGAPDPRNMPRGMPIYLDNELVKVFDLFRKDLARFEKRVNEAITVPLKQHEFDAAVSFDYNTGAIFKASWVKSLNAGNREQAAAQIMNWSKPKEIIPRRKAEQRLFHYGTYPEGKATVWGVTEAGKVVFKPVQKVDVAEYLKPQTTNWLSGLIAAIAAIFSAITKRDSKR